MCTHDKVELVDYVDDRLGYDGHVQYESKGYVCVECGEPVEIEDIQEAMAEAELMRLLGK